jgi:hypothetical protein
LQLHRKGWVASALAVVFVFWLSSFAEGGGSAVVVVVVVAIVVAAFVIAVATGNPNVPPSAFQPQKRKGFSPGISHAVKSNQHP